MRIVLQGLVRKKKKVNMRCGGGNDLVYFFSDMMMYNHTMRWPFYAPPPIFRSSDEDSSNVPSNPLTALKIARNDFIISTARNAADIVPHHLCTFLFLSM